MRFLENGVELDNFRIEGAVGETADWLTYSVIDRREPADARKLVMWEYFPREAGHRAGLRIDVAPAHQESYEAGLNRFLGVGLALRSITNDAVQNVRASFIKNGSAYIVAALPAGETIADILKRQGTLDRVFVASALRRLAIAIGDMHANDIAHMNIRPETIVRSDAGAPVIVSFERAWRTADAVRAVDPALERDPYSAIELTTPGESAPGFACDVYALAATGFTALFGIAPPLPGDRRRVIATGAQDPVELINLNDRTLEYRRLKQFIVAGLAIDADRRPSDIGHWISMLDRNSPAPPPAPLPRPVPRARALVTTPPKAKAKAAPGWLNQKNLIRAGVATVVVAALSGGAWYVLTQTAQSAEPARTPSTTSPGTAGGPVTGASPAKTSAPAGETGPVAAPPAAPAIETAPASPPAATLPDVVNTSRGLPPAGDKTESELVLVSQPQAMVDASRTQQGPMLRISATIQAAPALLVALANGVETTARDASTLLRDRKRNQSRLLTDALIALDRLEKKSAGSASLREVAISTAEADYDLPVTGKPSYRLLNTLNLSIARRKAGQPDPLPKDEKPEDAAAAAAATAPTPSAASPAAAAPTQPAAASSAPASPGRPVSPTPAATPVVETPVPARSAPAPAPAPAAAAPPPVQAASATPAASTPQPRVRQLKRVSAENPKYPSRSFAIREEGDTIFEVCSDAAGGITSATLARSSGSPRLDDAAQTWVARARFEPVKENGAPVAACGSQVTVRWRVPKN